MRKMLVILLLACMHASAQCPVQGDNKNPKIQAADRLKNRSYCPAKSMAHPVDLEALMADKVTDTGFVYVDCFITSAKISGIESCECHVKDKSMQDYHIYISYSGSDKLGSHNQIVEVSRYSRQLNPGIDYAYVKSLVGKKVRIYGYTFMDDEHKSAIGNWRAGIQ